MNYSKHESVLFNEVIDHLTYKQQDGKVYADLTFGAGGHSFALAQDPACSKIICFDQDPEAYQNGLERISKSDLKDKFVFINSNFANFEEKVDADLMFDGILMDLGVSSHHFDSAERGFSFRFNGPLDMRMNVADESNLKASDIVNQYECEELVNILRIYGEEKFAVRIAERICERRVEKPFETTKDLEDIVFHCYPKKMRHTGKNPATKTFQALRIEVNDELGVLERTLDSLVERLCLGGRLAVITFHSLEDRIVKQKFKNIEKNSGTPFEIVTKKPIVPTEREIVENSRSRSAKLRIIERVLAKKSKNKYPRNKDSKQEA